MDRSFPPLNILLWIIIIFYAICHTLTFFYFAKCAHQYVFGYICLDISRF